MDTCQARTPGAQAEGRSASHTLAPALFAANTGRPMWSVRTKKTCPPSTTATGVPSIQTYSRISTEVPATSFRWYSAIRLPCASWTAWMTCPCFTEQTTILPVALRNYCYPSTSSIDRISGWLAVTIEEP